MCSSAPERKQADPSIRRQRHPMAPRVALNEATVKVKGFPRQAAKPPLGAPASCRPAAARRRLDPLEAHQRSSIEGLTTARRAVAGKMPARPGATAPRRMHISGNACTVSKPPPTTAPTGADRRHIGAPRTTSPAPTGPRHPTTTAREQASPPDPATARSTELQLRHNTGRSHRDLDRDTI